MRIYVKILAMLLSGGLATTSCSVSPEVHTKSAEEGPGPVARIGSVHMIEAVAGCSPTEARNEACIEYRYDESRLLEVKTKYVVFNCCPKALGGHVILSEGAITIDLVEENGHCECLCLYDLSFKVDDVLPRPYTLRVNETYRGVGNLPLSAEIDLSKTGSGNHCVARVGYPYPALPEPEPEGRGQEPE